MTDRFEQFYKDIYGEPANPTQKAIKLVIADALNKWDSWNAANPLDLAGVCVLGNQSSALRSALGIKKAFHSTRVFVHRTIGTFKSTDRNGALKSEYWIEATDREGWFVHNTGETIKCSWTIDRCLDMVKSRDWIEVTEFEK